MATNFINELNDFNSQLGVHSTSESKYDYFACNISKKEQTSFRKKMRNSVKSFYASDNLDLNFVKGFINIQSSALLVCTKDKQKFESLSISKIYPLFEKLSELEKKQITDRHKKICSLLAPKEKIAKVAKIAKIKPAKIKPAKEKIEKVISDTEIK